MASKKNRNKKRKRKDRRRAVEIKENGGSRVTYSLHPDDAEISLLVDAALAPPEEFDGK